MFTVIKPSLELVIKSLTCYSHNGNSNVIFKYSVFNLNCKLLACPKDLYRLDVKLSFNLSLDKLIDDFCIH